MLIEVFLIGLAFIWIVFASIQDLKQREVADWLNFSLIIFALGFRFFYSLFNWNFSFFYYGLIGLAIFFALGNLFYYSRIFAGGDTKLFIALGTVLPLADNFTANLKILFLFSFVLFFIGSFYGLIWSFVLSFKNFKKFRSQFKKEFVKSKLFFYLGISLGTFVMILGFIENLFFYLGIALFILSYLYVYSKSVEESCMIKTVKSKNLREGDWLYRNLKIGNKIIKKSWNGLNGRDIKLIQKKYFSVKIKEGIPFVPVFLISFLIIVLVYFEWF